MGLPQLKAELNYKNNLLQGDTLEVLSQLPNGIMDLGVTSPPYNKQEKNNGWLVSKVVYSNYQDKLPEEEYQQQQVAVLDELYRLAKAGASFFYNHKVRWVDGKMLHPMDWLRHSKWEVKQEIIWDRTIAGNIRGWRFWQVEERIYWLYKPINNNKKGRELESKDAKLTSIWRAVPENNNPHPAPFPIWLPARIIISLLKEGQDTLVLDPYIGSGTTAVAAKCLGYNYLGIDIGQEYLDYAAQRIKNYQSEMDKIEQEKSLHYVHKSFKQRKQEKLAAKNNAVNEDKIKQRSESNLNLSLRY